MKRVIRKIFHEPTTWSLVPLQAYITVERELIVTVLQDANLLIGLAIGVLALIRSAVTLRDYFKKKKIQNE